MRATERLDSWLIPTINVRDLVGANQQLNSVYVGEIDYNAENTGTGRANVQLHCERAEHRVDLRAEARHHGSTELYGGGGVTPLFARSCAGHGQLRGGDE